MVLVVAKPAKIAKVQAKTNRHQKPKTVNVNGRNYPYENAELPDGIPVYRSVCEICQKASSYLMLREPPTVECQSCREDRIALYVLSVQEESGENFGYRLVDEDVRCRFLSRADVFGMHIIRKR